MTWREFLGNLANMALRPLGAELRSLKSIEARTAWKRDTAFTELFKTVRPHTLLTPDRLWVLWQFAQYAARLPLAADFAEVGVWRGGASYLLATLCAPRAMHVFDTFSGLPEADEDRLARGAFANTSEAHVRNLLAPLGNARIYPGFFPDTSSPIADRRFALVHLDVDLYSATRDGLAFYYPRIVPGGVIVVDDYRTLHAGVTRAVDEFLVATSETAMVLAVGQAVVVKGKEKTNNDD